jgi:hypothetical protein
MTDVISHRLDRNDAINHFLATLETGGSGAQERFLSMCDDGDFFALAPKGQTEERLRQFRNGGLFAPGKLRKKGKHIVTEVPNHADALASVIGTHLAKLARAAVLLHEPYLTECDKSKTLLELTTIGSARYKVLAPNQTTTADLAKEIGRFTVSWHALIILTENPDDFRLGPIAQGTVLLAVGAYDGESYAYWLRRAAAKHAQ